MSIFSSIFREDGIPCVSARPESAESLKETEVIKRFERYFKILRKKALPKFRLAQTLSVSYTPQDDETALWNEHDTKMEEMRDLFKDHSENELLQRQRLQSPPKPNLLTLKKDLAYKILSSCRFCERWCKVDRTTEEKGICNVGLHPKISTIFTHIGEEPVLIPSLTVFFSNCNFTCVFCQNYDISQRGSGETMSVKHVAGGITAKWKNQEIRNVNWVGGEPTPNLHYILEALTLLKVDVPQVWNSNLYCSIEALKLLEGVTDLWLPDFKYGNNACGKHLSKVPKYFDVVSRNLQWMSDHEEEILIRHLVLPNHHTCCTRPILKWIAENLNTDKVRVNVMEQYRPCWKAHNYPDIARPLRRGEWEDAVKYARELGLSLSI
ncbi:MAG: radical SAM protein [Candidatus Korarchaeota archaeon]|nr:radical SAM protein [Candidatus Korarchaeota archaeon]NIU84194.1 radical SAM protein [Candidatus Thorarchaeota archaeon]NIW14342.1 radical SAM protein [Candidatus Thorarchaeota archaeon]NIW52431.1 radical SAM protein [Candidatus Korarchaeota archaeon]